MEKIMKTGTPPTVNQLIDMALEEDLGRGDITCRLTVPEGLPGMGRVIARQDMVVSGIDIFAAVMWRVDPTVEVLTLACDGTRVAKNEVIATVKGAVDSMLMAERVALNFLQRLSGTATLTRAFVDALPEGSNASLVDTRKTTPGMRWLERNAVRDGGGNNHRVDLAGGILIKENHVAAAGGVANAVRLCRKGAPHPLKVEVEVRTEAELDEALAAGADCIMLDNMTTDQMARCVREVKGRAILEASGGVSIETVAAIAATGVDIISVGAFTHSAPAADISFLIDGVAPL